MVTLQSWRKMNSNSDNHHYLNSIVRREACCSSKNHHHKLHILKLMEFPTFTSISSSTLNVLHLQGRRSDCYVSHYQISAPRKKIYICLYQARQQKLHLVRNLTQVSAPFLSLTSSMISGKSFHLIEIVFPWLENGTKYICFAHPKRL